MMYGKINKYAEQNHVNMVKEVSPSAADEINDPLSFDKFDPLSLANNPFAFPIGIWSSPEAAYYGLSSQQALDMGVDAGEGKF